MSRCVKLWSNDRKRSKVCQLDEMSRKSRSRIALVGYAADPTTVTGDSPFVSCEWFYGASIRGSKLSIRIGFSISPAHAQRILLHFVQQGCARGFEKTCSRTARISRSANSARPPPLSSQLRRCRTYSYNYRTNHNAHVLSSRVSS